MGRILLRMAGIIGIVMLCFLAMALPVLAYIAEPDSTPTVEDIWCYRNVLETGDFLIIVYENTPYASIPDIDYSDAFVWRWMDTDHSTELAQAVGYDYHDNGYGYNIISFYLDASETPIWGLGYYLTLSGTPSNFEDELKYTYSIEANSYSSLTDSSEVKAAIANQILTIAKDLDNKWNLDTDSSLISESETGTVLSLYGQAFFRGAIYGVQSMAPGAFPLIIDDITATDRTWSTDYVDLLVAQYSGTYIETALTAGESLLAVDYNLMGILLILGLCLTVILANWYLSGGNLWKGFIDATPPLVIGARMALFGIGELGLLAAICWLYVSGKMWRIF